MKKLRNQAQSTIMMIYKWFDLKQRKSELSQEDQIIEIERNPNNQIDLKHNIEIYIYMSYIS